MNGGYRPTASRFAGGVDSRIDNLVQVVRYVVQHDPERSELLDWILASNIGIGTEGTFDKQVGFVETLGFLDERDEVYTVGRYGRELLGDIANGGDGFDVVYAALTGRVSGFRYLLDRLSRDPIHVDDAAEVLSEAYWNYEPSENVAVKHYNWLRAINYVERVDGTYRITPRGRSALDRSTPEPPEENTTGHVYEARANEVRVRDAFREHVFDHYGHRCLLTEIDRPEMLTLAHVQPRSERVDLAEDPTNVFVANWNHHRAFDAGKFTLDTDYRIHVAPDFETDHDWLRRTLIERDGNRVEFPSDAEIAPAHLRDRNQLLEWFPCH